ncbi:MAG: hypothetical protein Ct9H300mP2_1990 [Candidatus Neomarinimicrobiota bacterium]|nr:MAG: hypothetical protein Ct9H300mP2_1990 [Candidatus Neomarinimicrobiota bacterium]
MNGFANPRELYSDMGGPEDVAVWLEDEKWLRTVLLMNFTLVFFSVTKTWLPFPMNFWDRGTRMDIEGLANIIQSVGAQPDLIVP